MDDVLFGLFHHRGNRSFIYGQQQGTPRQTVDRLTGQRGKLEKSFNDLDSYYQYVIDKHRRPSWAVNKEDSEDLVDVLINLQKDPKNKFTLTDDHIKAILMDAFIGGIDTSSITILWAMSELMRNPRVLNKAQGEIRSHVSKKPRVGPLPYLKMVARETQRLHPPATLLLPRETLRPCEIGGYDIPARTRIFVNVWGIGQDPRYWENPEEFNPDRFDGTDVDFKGQNFELLPFGGGRRICPGLSMGAATVEFALALLYCFDWKLPEGTKAEDFSMEEEGELTTHRKMPLCLVPINYNV